MSRINVNVPALIANRVLGQNNQALNSSLERLSTGLRINRGKDDPAGLIASENLRAEQRGLDQAIANAQRADQVVNIVEGGLQEVSGLLTELQGLLTSSANEAGVSLEEKQANQLQIDSILQTIDRVAGQTNFQGTKLLNGNFDFKTSKSGSGVSDFKINSAKVPANGMDVNVAVMQSAQQAAIFLSAGGSQIDLATGSSFTIEVVGSLGKRDLSFTSGASLTSIAATVNTFKDVTGVEAVVSGTGIRLFSTEFGKDAVVKSAQMTSTLAGTSVGFYIMQDTNNNAADTTSVANGAGEGKQDTGQEMKANINGIEASVKGKSARISTDFLDVELTLTTAKAQAIGSVGTGGDSGSAVFKIDGGGAKFALSSRVDMQGTVSIGLQDVSVRKIGNSSVGFLDSLKSGGANNVVDGDTTQGQKVVGEAIKQVSMMRGRLGAFQRNTVGATIRSLNISSENTAAAQSIIRDADFANETANLTRSQILVSASTNVLSLANSTPQSALQLLG
jgi:flagellin